MARNRWLTQVITKNRRRHLLMRLLLYIIGVLFVAIVATLFAIEDPGYVLIARTPWSIELSLVVFIILSAITFFALTILLYLVARAWMIPRYLKKLQQNRSQSSADENLVNGLLALAAGHWSEARQTLESDMEYASHPVINYLGAAIAEQRLGENSKRDKSLSLAVEHSPGSAPAISKFRARLYHQAKQYKEELAVLTDLREQDKEDKDVLRGLIEVHKKLKDWPELAALLPKIESLDVLTEADYLDLELHVHCKLLGLSLPSESAQLLEQVWASTPRSVQQNPRAIAMYCRKLNQQKEYDQAEKLIRTSLGHTWDDDLVRLYGQTNTSTPENQLLNVEQWLNDRSDNQALLVTAGRLAKRAGHLDKALGYLEQANMLSTNTEIYLEIARVLEKQGKTSRALESYRLGLDHSRQTQD